MKSHETVNEKVKVISGQITGIGEEFRSVKTSLANHEQDIKKIGQSMTQQSEISGLKEQVSNL